ncbi:MAG: DUF1552 domain-containing protein [Myxococcota bacterium]
MTRKLSGRRAFLSALGLGAGAWVLSPMLRQLLTEAHGQPSATKRFILYINELGVPGEYRPNPGASGIELGPWAPLAPHRSDLTVLKNLYNPFDLDLHGNLWPFCGTVGQSSGDSVQPGGPSFDRFIAERIGAFTPLRSVNIGLWTTTPRRILKSHSAEAAGVALPAEGPAEAFGRVFGGDASTMPEEMDNRLAMNRSLLDGVVGDIERMNGRLAASERERMDQYLTSVRELETQLARVATARGSCSAPVAPDPDVIGSGGANLARAEAGANVLVAALTCGFTNVATINAGSAGGFLGSGIGSHKMWHGDGTVETHSAFYGHQAGQLASIWQALKDTPEGDGTMADNTVLMWANAAGGKHHSGSYDSWVMALHGGTPGDRALELPESEVEAGPDPRRALVNSGIKRAPSVGRNAPVHAINDAFITVAQMLGVGIETFGDERLSQGVLPGVL